MEKPEYVPLPEDMQNNQEDNNQDENNQEDNQPENNDEFPSHLFEYDKDLEDNQDEDDGDGEDSLFPDGVDDDGNEENPDENNQDNNQNQPNPNQEILDEISKLKDQLAEAKKEPARDFKAEGEALARRNQDIQARMQQAVKRQDQKTIQQLQNEYAALVADDAAWKEEYTKVLQAEKDRAEGKPSQAAKDKLVEIKNKHKWLMHPDHLEESEYFDKYAGSLAKYGGNPETDDFWNKVEQATFKKFPKLNPNKSQNQGQNNPTKNKPRNVPKGSGTADTSKNRGKQGPVKKGWPSDFSRNKLSKMQDELAAGMGMYEDNDRARGALKTYWETIKAERDIARGAK